MKRQDDGAKLCDLIVSIGEVRGELGEIFAYAESAGATVIESEPLTSYGRGVGSGERLLYVRSLTTGFWYEHAFENETHPFVRWQLDSQTSDLAQESREDVTFAGIFYKIAGNVPLCGEDAEQIKKTVRQCLYLSMAFEQRDLVRKMMERGLIQRAFGLEASMREFWEKLEAEEPYSSGVLRLQVPAPCHGEAVMVLLIENGRSVGRHPYLPGFGSKVREKLEFALQELPNRDGAR